MNGRSLGSPARQSFIAAALEFRQLATQEVEQLERDVVRARGRGLTQLAGDLARWRDRLRRLLMLAEAVEKEPGVKH